MEKKNSSNEKLLYHGTSYDVADAICFQNFDFRLCGKNATMFGKGTYFSTTASYSHIFAKPDSKGYHYMFIAKVLVGRHAAVGHASSFVYFLFCIIFFQKPFFVIFENLAFKYNQIKHLYYSSIFYHISWPREACVYVLCQCLSYLFLKKVVYFCNINFNSSTSLQEASQESVSY